MRIRCFAIEPLSEKPNGNSLQKKDWAMVSYANDIFEVPDDAGNADITRRLVKYIKPGRLYTLFVREDEPNRAHEIISSVPYSRRTRALKLWCLGNIELRNYALRIIGE